MLFRSMTTLSAAPVRRRGRQPSATGIAPGAMKVWQAAKDITASGRSGFALSLLVEKTGLASNTVKAYISTLKTKHSISILPYGRNRGNSDPWFYLSSTSASQPQASPWRRVGDNSPVQDTLWREIDSDIKAFYLERAMELNGFAVNVSMG